MKHVDTPAPGAAASERSVVRRPVAKLPCRGRGNHADDMSLALRFDETCDDLTRAAPEIRRHMQHFHSTRPGTRAGAATDMPATALENLNADARILGFEPAASVGKPAGLTFSRYRGSIDARAFPAKSTGTRWRRGWFDGAALAIGLSGSPLKIAVDARSYFMRTGIARYTRGLLHALVSDDSSHRWL